MDKKYEMQVMNSKAESGMRIKKGDKSLEFSPEISQQICGELTSLAVQLISGAERITVDYFKNQSNLYLSELSAYMSAQTYQSEERKKMLEDANQAVLSLTETIKETDDVDKIEAIKSVCEMILEKRNQAYLKALDKNITDSRPKRPNLLEGLSNLFTGHK